ncbi:MAG: isoprenoid biosynthesis glyoxalase ElbB [Aaplasma endosymbiont of Hyalomma asiaticum]
MRCAVLLCGCGHIDGSEINESVLSLLELDRMGVQAVCCACDAEQIDVINHRTKEKEQGKRRILDESARISRGRVEDVQSISPSNFDMLLLPGGLGVAKNYSNILESGDKVEVKREVKELILGFYQAKKVIGAVCISPALVAASLSEVVNTRVTLGDDTNEIIKRCGGTHVYSDTDGFCVDTVAGVFSCSAYMRDESLHRVHLGIRKMVEAMVDRVKNGRN